MEMDQRRGYSVYISRFPHTNHSSLNGVPVAALEHTGQGGNFPRPILHPSTAAGSSTGTGNRDLIQKSLPGTMLLWLIHITQCKPGNAYVKQRA